MTDLELPFRELAELQVSAQTEHDRLTIRLTGTADMRVSDALELLFREVHDHAVSSGLAQVDVNMTELQFMNSSCFKSLVGWIVSLQGIEPERRYHVRFLSDSELLWQRRSLKTLSCFAPDLISVSVA